MDRKPASQSLRGAAGANQRFFMVMTLFGGLYFWVLARYLDDPVLQVESYGSFVLAVKAEWWAIPLALGSGLSIVGQVVNGDPRLSPWVTPTWRLIGALVVLADLALFAYGGTYAPTFHPIFAYSVFGAGSCIWFACLSFGDLRRALRILRDDV